MSLHLASTLAGHLGPERKLKNRITVRLIEPDERANFDAILTVEHYLSNPTAVGAVLRYVVTSGDEWLALAVFCSAALHLKPRDQWLQWNAVDVPQRRHLIAQNSRCLVRANGHRYPNLASCILGQIARRIAQDWQRAFGYPVLALETFIDPQRFRGTCYQAAGWHCLGKTRGSTRRYQEFYEDTDHPKELWMRPLGRKNLPQLPRAPASPGSQASAAGLSGADRADGFAVGTLPQGCPRLSGSPRRAPSAARSFGDHGPGGVRRLPRARSPGRVRSRSQSPSTASITLPAPAWKTRPIRRPKRRYDSAQPQAGRQSPTDLRQWRR